MPLRYWGVALGVGVLMVGSALAIAEETKQSSGKGDLITVKEKGGTRFLSLSDWPVTRKGGVIKAAPLEEYLSMKFGQINDALERATKRLDALEQQMTKMDEGRGMLLNRMKGLEERMTPQPQEVGHGDTAQGSREAAEGTTGGVP